MRMIAESVVQKVEFARARLRDLDSLIAQGRLGSDPYARHQLTQEFFFHLIGAAEYLAQLVNEQRSLGMRPEKVAVYKVVRALEKQAPSDPLIGPLKCLCADTRKTPLPADPYSPEALTWRAINYRNTVAHRSINPFHFVMSAGPKVAYFWLDPANTSLGHSANPVDVELASMLSLVELRCEETLGIL